ncbi:unnamed protein product [Rotaria socialis]
MNSLIVARIALDVCTWKFDHYTQSSWEMYWHNNIDELQNHVCFTLGNPDQMQNSIQALERIITLQRSIFNGTSILNVDKLFSKMVYRLECVNNRSRHLITQNIEPLIGFLRDPLTICPNISSTVGNSVFHDITFALQSKRFLLLAPSAPYENVALTSPIPPWLGSLDGQKILIDIGSSLFNELEGMRKIGAAISSRWFYEYFKKISLKFDRIIAFEQGPRNPKIFFEQIPADLLPIYTFINVAVEPFGKFNPWKILERVAKPNDYVIVKLDIDASNVEKDFIEQILKNEVWLSLIDEMFFEMHVNVKEMESYWGGGGLDSLKDAYNLFSKLRQSGIRMHSWP